MVNPSCPASMLLQVARIDGAHAGIRRQRVMMRRYRQEDPVDRLGGSSTVSALTCFGASEASSEEKRS